MRTSDLLRLCKGTFVETAFVDDIAAKGIVKPVSIQVYLNGEMHVLDGQRRVKAAGKLRIEFVPVKFNIQTPKTEDIVL